MPRAATAEPKLENGTEFDFYSRHRHLRLIRVPLYTAPNAYGQLVQQDVIPGVRQIVYEFENGHLQVVVGGKNWHVVPDGKGGEMQNTLDWLRGHEDMNARFHEAGAEPDRPLPSDEDFMDMVNAASLELDVDRITELLRVERETHNRPNLVSVADRARKRTLQARQVYESQVPDEAA